MGQLAATFVAGIPQNWAFSSQHVLHTLTAPLFFFRPNNTSPKNVGKGDCPAKKNSNRPKQPRSLLLDVGPCGGTPGWPSNFPKALAFGHYVFGRHIAGASCIELTLSCMERCHTAEHNQAKGY